MRALRLLALLSVFALPLAACGDDDEGGGDTAATTIPDAALCPAMDLTLTYADTGQEVALTSGGAIGIGDLSSYTAYAADFPIAPGDVSVQSTPSVPAGGNLAKVDITLFNERVTPPAVEPGLVIVHDMTEAGGLTFVVAAQRGGELLEGTEGGAGTIEVLGVGEQLCLRVEYSDVEKSLEGVLTAELNEY